MSGLPLAAGAVGMLARDLHRMASSSINGQSWCVVAGQVRHLSEQAAWRSHVDAFAVSLASSSPDLPFSVAAAEL